MTDYKNVRQARIGLILGWLRNGAWPVSGETAATAADDIAAALAGRDAEIARLRKAKGSPLCEIAAERERQKEAEGWTTEHDDEHTHGELALAASCYAAHAGGRYHDALPAIWPWSRAWWKPKDARRDLIRAGALIVAEIERLDRAAEKEGR